MVINEKEYKGLNTLRTFSQRFTDEDEQYQDKEKISPRKENFGGSEIICKDKSLTTMTMDEEKRENEDDNKVKVRCI